MTVLVLVALVGLLFFPRFWLLAIFIVLQAGLSAVALSAAWDGANSVSHSPIPDQLFWQSDSLWSAILRLIVLIAVGVVIVSARKLWRTHKSDRVPTEGSAGGRKPIEGMAALHTLAERRRLEPACRQEYESESARLAMNNELEAEHQRALIGFRYHLLRQGLIMFVMPFLVAASLAGFWFVARWVWRGFQRGS